MVDIPDDYLQFQVMIAVPDTITKDQFIDIFSELCRNVDLHWREPKDSPNVMALRTSHGDLVGAITRVKGGN